MLPGEHVLTASLDLFAAVNIHGVLGQPKPTLRRTGGTMPLVTSNMPAPGVLRHLRIQGRGITDGFNPVLGAYGGGTHTELEVIADGVTAAAKPKACATRKSGSRKNQTLRGGRLGDLLAGLGGNDVLRGLAGADCLKGGKGNDLLIGGPGIDRFSGGPGSDRILAKDGTRDSVDCGPGRDSVVADRKDRLRRCERVKRR